MNDLWKYYKKEYKDKIKRARIDFAVRAVCCIFLVVLYFITSSVFQLILAVFGGIFGFMYLIGFVALLISPEKMLPPEGYKEPMSRLEEVLFKRKKKKKHKSQEGD